MLCCSGRIDDLHVPTFYLLNEKNVAGIRDRHIPAVNCVPASVAVLRNSSRSLSCVIDCRRVVESTSVVY